MSQKVTRIIAVLFKQRIINVFHSTMILKMALNCRSRGMRSGDSRASGQLPARFLMALALFISLVSVAWGQVGFEHSKDKVDQTLRSNARVNPSTLAMELSIPIADLPGRGSATMPLVFNYSSKVWQIRAIGAFRTNGGERTEASPVYSDDSMAGWTSSYYIPTIDTIVEPYDCRGNATGDTTVLPEDCYGTYYYVKRIRAKLPDGSTHELRKDDRIHTTPNGVMDKTGTFYAVDGTRVRLEWGATGDSTLFLPDGGRYFFDANLNCSKYVDRHGNFLTYNSTTGAWTDTMGRTLASPIPFTQMQRQNQAEGTQSFTVPGLGTTNRQYQLVWKKLSTGALVTGDSLAYDATMCNEVGPISRSPLLFQSEPYVGRLCSPQTGYFDPVVLSEIILPNNQKYKFAYNRYGLIARIDYPTGAYENFTYDDIKGLGWDYQQNYGVAHFYGQANLGVVDRYVGTDDVTARQEWNYSAGYESTAYDPSTYVMTTTAPDGTVNKRLLHRAKRPVNLAYGNYGFDTILAGMEIETQMLDTAGAIRSRKLIEWEVTQGTRVGNSVGAYPQRDARVKREVGVIFDPSTPNQALATMNVNTYDDNADPRAFAKLNPKRSEQYGFLVLTASEGQNLTREQIVARFTSGNLLKAVETDYKYDGAYLDRGFVGLPIATRLNDAANVTKSKTEIFYDTDGGQTLIPASGALGWENPNTSVRGLVTKTKAWVDATNTWIETKAQYDDYGNLRQSWDARGALTTTLYDATHQVYPVRVTTPIPGDGTNGSGAAFVTIMTYDATTGALLSTTDTNGLRTTMEYNDLLLRPTRVSTSFGGQPVGSQTVTEYGVPDSSGQLPAAQRFVHVKSQIDANSWAESWQWFDGLARTIKTQKKDLAGDVFAFTFYDNLGRVSAISNPLRNPGTQPSCQTNLKCTTSIYDEVSRVKEIDSPLEAGQTIVAKVLTSYNLATSGGAIGTTVTVTDQSGKLRRSITNALGQLLRVDEPIGAGLGSTSAPSQPTNYTYDTLGNLLSVTQAGTSALQCTGVATGSIPSCSQNRSFVYDSLSRLKSATNPESGTISYSYDPNGNLLTKTDARNITTTFVYDSLNRVTSRNYSDGVTPAVNYYYDGTGLESVPSNSKGKLTRVASSVSETRYTLFDELGRTKASQQITDGVTYNFSDYSYNLAGALVSQTYPSGRQVENVFDADGDLAAVSSRARSNVPMRTFASNFSYTAAGAVSLMQLGNGRWETTLFNNRLQPTQLGLGTTNVAANADLWRVNYEYGMLDSNGATLPGTNNGNVGKQILTVPSVTLSGVTTPGFTATQYYGYDSLNRLQTAAENYTLNGDPTVRGAWRQSFAYDRFGNRRFDYINNGGTNTPAATSGEEKVINPLIDPANNRLKQDQGGDPNAYLYDAAGNLIKDALGKRFVYDGENKQSQFFDVGNGSATPNGTYVYDGDGKRVKKITQTETTIFVYDASGKMVAEYSTLPPPPPAQATTSYLTNDHLGSPRVITDQTGKVTSRRDFLPFGEDVFSPQRTPQLGYQPDNIRQGFTGYLDDEESGLEFAEARMYATQHGRFTSPDPLLTTGRPVNPKTWNRYVYTLNNPLVFTDPTGLYECSGNEKECKRFESGLQKANEQLAKIGKRYGTGLTEYTDAARALKSYGTLGDKNGVTVGFGKLGGNTLGSTIGTLKNTGKNTVDVTIDPDKNKSNSDLLTTIAHEGSHVADNSDYQGALLAAYSDANDPGGKIEAVMSGSLRVTHGQSETRAFGVSSVFAEFLLGGGAGGSAMSAGGGTTFNLGGEPERAINVGGESIWKSSWQKLDVETIRKNRSAAIAKGLPKSDYAPLLNKPIQ